MRIVSLLPSATEIICALGAREQLVGVSHECDFPAGIEALPHCSAVKRPLGHVAREIDRNVKALLEESLSVYRVETERLRTLAPDLIVTQAQCEICAVSENEVVAALAEWTGRRPALLSLQPMSLKDVWRDIERAGAALGRVGQAKALVAEAVRRIATIARRAEAAPSHPRVALIDWLDPPIMGAEWMPELVRLAGGEPVLARTAQHAERTDWPSLQAAAPDVILVAPCGLSMAEAATDLPVLADFPGNSQIPAWRKGEVYLADGKHYFNRPGPRLVESLEILAEILHPALFHFGHEGKAWRRT